MASTPKYKNIFGAAENNDLEALKEFVDKNPRLLTRTTEEEKWVGLIAAMNNNFPMLHYILEAENRLLHHGDLFGNDIMQRSIELNAIDTVKYLVETQNWDIHRRNNRYFGNTPIHHAAEEGKLEILKYLIEGRHGDVNVRNNVGEPPLFNAAETPHMNVIKYLIEELKADVTAINDKGENVLFVSAVKGDLIVPKYLLDERKIPFDINHRNKFNYTALYLAARWNKLSFIEYVVNEKQADVNIADEQQRSPLHSAAFRGYNKTCEFLVEHGADLRAIDKFGNTPDKDASDEEHPSLAKYLRDMENKRYRRSVDNLSFWYPDGTLTLERTFAESLTGRKSLPLVGDEQYPAETVNNPKFDSYLMIGNTIIRYNERSLKRKSKQKILLSPAEFVQSKVDPLAVDAVNIEPR